MTSFDTDMYFRVYKYFGERHFLAAMGFVLNETAIDQGIRLKHEVDKVNYLPLTPSEGDVSNFNLPHRSEPLLKFFLCGPSYLARTLVSVTTTT